MATRTFPQVKVFDGVTADLHQTILAFEAGFAGGVAVSASVGMTCVRSSIAAHYPTPELLTYPGNFSGLVYGPRE